METELVKEGDLSKDDLDPNDAFLVSAGALGIWVWLGRHATAEERQGAMRLVFLRHHDRHYYLDHQVGGEVHPGEGAAEGHGLDENLPVRGA